MEYSIQELSRLSGVTTRTLRWYDQIGLLKPSRVAESGYRYYGRAEVDRLQDILYYRALGVELARIKECLDDPSFDRLAALRNHLAALEAEQERLEQLIRSVKDTIGAEERNEIMSDEQKFEAFNFHVINIDGHDFDAIDAAFKEAKATKGQPTAIIAKTVKGKGVSFMENQCSWHGTAPNDEQYAQAMEELEKAGESLCQK